MLSAIMISLTLAVMIEALYASYTAIDGMLEIEASKDNDVIDTEAKIMELADKYDPEEVREELKKLARTNPYLKPVVKQCIKHLDTMDALQEAVNRMVETGYAGEKLENISESLNDVEQEICQNMQDILTICIAGGSLNGNITLDDIDQDELESEMSSNEEKLAKVKELVRLCGKYVIQKDDAATNVNLDSWISTLEKLVN